MTRPFSLPWQVNGSRAGGQLVAQPGEARVARVVRGARTGHDVGAEVPQTARHHRIGVDGHEHPQPPPAARASTAAARAALPQLAIARSGRAFAVGQPEPLGDLEVEQHAHEVPSLVRPRDVAGLVLDPHSPGGAEPEAVRQRVVAAERRGPEAMAGDAGHRVVEPGGELGELVFAHARGGRPVVAVQETAVVHER